MKKYLRLAKQFIEIQSTKNNLSDLNKVIKLASKNLTGFTVEPFESNGIPSLLSYFGKKRPAKFKIILNAHLDVVPGKSEQFMPYEKNGKLYGRGAYDMKAAAAVMIHVIKEIAKKLPYDIALQLVTDEEIGGHNGTKYQIAKGVKADFVIAGENTDFTIRNQAKGVFWAKIHAQGKTSHGAYPWLGDNALWNLYGSLTKIMKAFPIPKNGKWQTTVNVAKIQTDNTTFNQVPNTATAFLDIRYIPQDEKNIKKKIEKLLLPKTNLEVVLFEPPAYARSDDKFIKKLIKSFTKIEKKQPVLTSAAGASDVRFYTSIGSSGIEFGLKGANHHADNEWVDIKSLEDYYNILKDFLLHLTP